MTLTLAETRRVIRWAVRHPDDAVHPASVSLFKAHEEEGCDDPLCKQGEGGRRDG